MRGREGRVANKCVELDRLETRRINDEPESGLPNGDVGITKNLGDEPTDSAWRSKVRLCEPRGKLRVALVFIRWHGDKRLVCPGGPNDFEFTGRRRRSGAMRG